MWSKGSALRRFGEGQVDISICSKAALKQHSSRTIKALVEDLKLAQAQTAARVMTKGFDRDLCKGCGFDLTPFGVFSSPRVVDAMSFPQSMVPDWAHSLLQEGPFNQEFSAFVSNVSDGAGSSFRSYYRGWFWTSHMRPSTLDKMAGIMEG